MRLTGASPDGWGSISADRQFLKALREYCDRTGTQLIYDEVVTGFRLGLGGAHGYFVEPDLTVLGKIIGGGLPIGAICGRRDVMEHMDHTKYSGMEYFYHGGSFAGNPITLAAGLATINVLEHSPVYEHIDKPGNMARQDMNRIFEDADFPAQAVGVGSLFAVHLTNKKPLKDISDFTHYDLAQSKRRFNYLLENGIVILIPEMMHGAASYAHKEKDINYLTTCAENVKSRS